MVDKDIEKEIDDWADGANLSFLVKSLKDRKLPEVPEFQGLYDKMRLVLCNTINDQVVLCLDFGLLGNTELKLSGMELALHDLACLNLRLTEFFRESYKKIYLGKTVWGDSKSKAAIRL